MTITPFKFPVAILSVFAGVLAASHLVAPAPAYTTARATPFSECTCAPTASMSATCSACTVTFTITSLTHVQCTDLPDCQPTLVDALCKVDGTITFLNCTGSGSRPVVLRVGCGGHTAVVYPCPSGTGGATVQMNCDNCAPFNP